MLSLTAGSGSGSGAVDTSELCSGAHPVTSYVVNYILTFLERGDDSPSPKKKKMSADKGKEKDMGSGLGNGTEPLTVEGDSVPGQQQAQGAATVGYADVLEAVLRDASGGRTQGSLGKEALEILAALHRNMEARVHNCSDPAVKTLFRLNNACHIDRCMTVQYSTIQ